MTGETDEQDTHDPGYVSPDEYEKHQEWYDMVEQRNRNRIFSNRSGRRI